MNLEYISFCKRTFYFYLIKCFSQISSQETYFSDLQIENRKNALFENLCPTNYYKNFLVHGIIW